MNFENYLLGTKFHLLAYENLKSAREVLIEIVRKSVGSTICAGSATHCDHPLAFTMPYRWSSFAFRSILWTKTFFKKTIFATLRLAWSW